MSSHKTMTFKGVYLLKKSIGASEELVTIFTFGLSLKKYCSLCLKALTDHFRGGSRVVSFDPYSKTGGSESFFLSF